MVDFTIVKSHLQLRTTYSTIDLNKYYRDNFMEYMSVSNARKNLYQIVDDVANNHEPTLIKGKRNTAVLVSIEDWENIQETLFVAKDKSLSKSLLQGMKQAYEDCATKLDW